MRVLALTLLIAVVCGCTNFENPLPWEESPLAESLIGSWQTSKESATPFRMTVSRTDESGLQFRFDFEDDENGVPILPSFVRSDDAISASFSANLLASNDVHVLQIDTDSYVEEDGSDENKETHKRSGYQFVHVVPSDEQTAFQLLDIETFSQFAEEALMEIEISFSIARFADCLDDGARSFIVYETLKEGIEEGTIELPLEEDLTELGELREVLGSREQVNPYKALQEMRECIAYKLTGYELGRLFEQFPKRSFDGEVMGMERTP